MGDKKKMWSMLRQSWIVWMRAQMNEQPYSFIGWGSLLLHQTNQSDSILWHPMAPSLYNQSRVKWLLTHWPFHPHKGQAHILILALSHAHLLVPINLSGPSPPRPKGVGTTSSNSYTMWIWCKKSPIHLVRERVGHVGDKGTMCYPLYKLYHVIVSHHHLIFFFT